MATNIQANSQAQDHQTHTKGFADLRSPGLLAKHPLIGFIMFIFGSLVFAGLTYNLLAHGPLLELDVAIANSWPAIALRSPVFIKYMMEAGFYLGRDVVLVLTALIGVYFLSKRYWQELALLMIGWAGSALLFFCLSTLLGRPRPPTQIWIIVNIPGFPSGHAIAVVVFYGLMAYLLAPKMRSVLWKVVVVIAALFMMIFIGFSRVFTGGHYLTDILSGYAVGVAWFGLAYTLIEIYYRKKGSQHAPKG